MMVMKVRCFKVYFRKNRLFFVNSRNRGFICLFSGLGLLFVSSTSLFDTMVFSCLPTEIVVF